VEQDNFWWIFSLLHLVKVIQSLVMNITKLKNNHGYTLIELLVVLTIIGILSGMVAIATSIYYQTGRDAKRQSDIRSIQGAVEQYRNQYGRYPEACNGPDNWSGAQNTGSSYRCTDGRNEYIVGVQEFINPLPNEIRKGNVVNGGYIYKVNASGTSYKIMVRDTVERTPITPDDPLSGCDRNVCGTDVVCNPNNATYQSSYAVWGGFANGSSETQVLNNTRAIWCSN